MHRGIRASACACGEGTQRDYGRASMPRRHTLLISRSLPSTFASACVVLVLSLMTTGAPTPSHRSEPVAGNADNSLHPPQGGQANVTVVLESDGGSVLGALDLGRAIRRFGFTTTVGRVIERRAATPIKHGETTSRADCQSMCAFVLLGGVQRHVPPDARVLVHQIWLGDRREDAVAANYTAEDLVVLSLRVPPWEPMRALTREELRRMKLDQDVEVPTTAAVVKTAAGPTLPDEETLQVPPNGRGWIAILRAGQSVLARTHPLTLEGERI